MSGVLTRWNEMVTMEAAAEIGPCCGSSAWIAKMVNRRPFREGASLLVSSDEIWNSLAVDDWLEAFKSHPKIGESRAEAEAAARSKSWSEQEQRNVGAGDDESKLALTAGNRRYEKKFGFIFIVCATGKSATEILAILERRLQNEKEIELFEAAEEQRKITQIRLKKWLSL